MTSSDDLICKAADMVSLFIKGYVASPLVDSGYLEGLATSAWMSEFADGLDDWWPSLIARSETSRPTFKLLCRLSARFISSEKEMPMALQIWLVDCLNGIRSEPSFGRSGPNRTALEHVLLHCLVREVTSNTGLPVWPSASQAPHHNAIAIVALGSKRVKEAGLKTCFPVGEKALETRFIKACRWLATGRVNNSAIKP